jgi:hypothetical protein
MCLAVVWRFKRSERRGRTESRAYLAIFLDLVVAEEGAAAVGCTLTGKANQPLS